MYTLVNRVGICVHLKRLEIRCLVTRINEKFLHISYPIKLNPSILTLFHKLLTVEENLLIVI